MKRALILIPGLVAVLAGGGTPAGEDPLAPLQKELDEQKQTIDRLAVELAGTRETLDETVAYLQSGAKSAAQLLSCFQEAEAGGFTKGINWRSREVLLDGLREHAQSLQKDVPGSAAKGKRAGDKTGGKPAPAPAPKKRD